jgi:hypothetical protein
MTIQNEPYSRPSLWVLVAWGRYRLSEALAAIKPKHRADEIAAVVARSGNPSGA